MSERADVVVVGGGLAGLLTGVELARRGVDALVLEAGEGPGGIVRSVHVDGYTVEPAAGVVVLPHPHLGPILAEAGVGLHAAVGAGLRHVLTPSGLVALPNSARAILTSAVGWRGKARALAEPLVRTPAPTDDDTLADFLRRRFGREAGTLAATLMAAGVYAGDPERLSARAAFPGAVALEATYGSVVRGAIARRRAAVGEARVRPVHQLPDGGMSGLVDTLAARLGDRFRSRREVTSVEQDDDGTWWVEGVETTVAAGHVVLAVAPHLAAPLVGRTLSPLLTRARAAPVAVVALGGRGRALPAGFGYLVGPGAGWLVVGCLFESSYAPERAPEGHWLAKVIVGGARNPGAVDQDDDDLVGGVLAEVRGALGSDLAPEMTHVIRHRPGIPQYEVGHAAALGAFERLAARQPGLHVTGWGYHGIGVPHLASDAVRVADAVTA